MLNKSNLLSFMKNFSKNLKTNFCCLLTLLLRSRSLALGWKMQLCDCFFINLYLFDSNFSGIARIILLHNFIEEICLINNGCYRNEKKDTISGIIATFAKRIKYFKNTNVTHSNYH